MALCLLPPDPRLATAKIAVKSAKILMFASCCDIVPTSDGPSGGTSSAAPTLPSEAAGGTGNLGRQRGAVITIDGFRMGGSGRGDADAARAVNIIITHSRLSLSNQQLPLNFTISKILQC